MKTTRTKQKKTDRPLVVDARKITIIEKAKKKGSQVEAFGNIYEEAPQLIWLMTKEFSLISAQEENDILTLTYRASS